MVSLSGHHTETAFYTIFPEIFMWNNYDIRKSENFNQNENMNPGGESFQRDDTNSGSMMTFPQLDCIVKLISNTKYWIEHGSNEIGIYRLIFNISLVYNWCQN